MARETKQSSNSTGSQQRITISLGIVAMAVGFYAIPATSNALSIMRGALTIQGILAFLFILSTATGLKFKGTGSLFDIKISKKVEHFFYDTSIEMFWATLYAGIAGLVLSHFTLKTILLWFAGFLAATIVLLIAILNYKRNRTDKKPQKSHANSG